MKRKNLLKFLIDNNLTQTDLAETLDVSKQQLSRLVNCKTNPSFGLMLEFEKMCNKKNIVIEDMWEIWRAEE